MSEITINLNKAQKLLDRIKKLIDGYNLQKNNLAFSTTRVENCVTVNFTHQGREEMEDSLEEGVEDKREYYDAYLNLIADLSSVRQALFSGNVKSGVSEILNRIEDERRVKEFWETFLQNTSSDGTFIDTENMAEYYATQCERVKTLAVSSSFVVKREIYSKQELNQWIGDCVSKIDKYEDERDHLNHQFNITVELSPSTLAKLGLA